VSVILAKLAIGLGAALLGALLGSWRRLYELPERRFDVLAVGLTVASRLSIFVAVFVVLGFDAQADVLGYYFPQAQKTLAGQLVYRDFPSSYAPLFSYLGAGALLVWRSPRSLILLAILFEALSLPLWLRAARALGGDRAARTAMVLYACNALPILNVAIDGQNQSYCAFVFALSVALLVARRPFLSGLAAGASLGVVKLIGILHAPAPFAAAGAGRARFFVGGALIPLVTYGGFMLAGTDVLGPARVESGLNSSGNVPFLLTLIASGKPSPLWSAMLTLTLVAALGAVVLWALWTGAAASPQAMMPFGALVLLTFMIVSKKSYTHYLVIGLFPLAATVAARAPRFPGMLAFGLFGALAAIEPTLWFRWLGTGDLGLLLRPAPGVSRALVAGFALCDAALVAAYVVLWRQALGLLRGVGLEVERVGPLPSEPEVGGHSSPARAAARRSP